MAGEKLDFLLNTAIWTPPQSDREKQKSNKYFNNWFKRQFGSQNENENRRDSSICQLEEFAVFFLNFLRQQTEIHLRNREPETQLKIDEPKIRKCGTPCSQKSEDVFSSGKVTNLSTPRLVGENSMQPERHNTTFQEEASYIRIKKKDSLKSNSSTQISTFHGNESESSFSLALQSNTSTPVQQRSRNTSNSCRSAGACSTPSSTDKQTRSSGSRVCLGDFMVLSNSPRSTKKKTPHQQNTPDTPNKPKKRVVPTTVSRRDDSLGGGGGAFSNNPAFSNDNNILKHSNAEIVDKNKCTIMEARKSLKTSAKKISEELESAAGVPLAENKSLRVVIEKAVGADKKKEDYEPINFENVEHRTILDRLGDIYSALIDLNFTANVLNELSYLLNLLNANQSTHEVSSETGIKPLGGVVDIPHAKVLKSITNCVYFALRVLHKQRNILSLLDLKSLGVVLSSERLAMLASDLNQFLEQTHQKKQRLEIVKSSTNENSFRIDKSFNNVYYQQENDSRTNFSSHNEFAAFKSQRDIFYKILKQWEVNHLNPAWSFATQVVPMIQMLFKCSEHPINMAHFAKLFVSQLLISSDRSVASPSELGVDMDLQKYSKLTQRLTAPSKFSVDYQFPGFQAFFLEFLVEARSIPFMEQMKITIFSELMTLNNSTFEVINLSHKEEEEENDGLPAEYVVRPEILSTMQVLAKFLGLIVAQPFIYNGGNSAIEKKQLLLRNQLFPCFDVCRIVQNAHAERKLLITIPWLVQYLAMLDKVTLQLDNHRRAIQMLFDIYTDLDSSENSTSVFILRCCLGWLFENSTLSDQYYMHRQQVQSDALNSVKQQTGLDEAVPSGGSGQLNLDQLKQEAIVNKVSSSGFTKCLEQVQTTMIESNEPTLQSSCSALELNPMLESILIIACPFLAEFRVSIMPAKYSTAKYLSRTGRYRHITTRLSEIPVPALNSVSSSSSLPKNNKIDGKAKRSQDKLIEAFMHSQNLSMRRIIEFIIERTYSAVVKDSQIKILMPLKSSADNNVNAIRSEDITTVEADLNQIYTHAQKEAVQQWNKSVAEMIKTRAAKALDALLPAETSQVIRRTYLFLICEKCETKVNEWRYLNLTNLGFFCSDIAETAEKIVKANSKERQNFSSSLVIESTTPCLSGLLGELQYWLHCTTRRPELITKNADKQIEDLLHQMRLAFAANTLPHALYRLVGTTTLQLMLNLIKRHPLLVTSKLIDGAKDIWLTNEMKHIPVKMSPSAAQSSNITFAGLISVSFIQSLADPRSSFEKLEMLLVALVQSQLVTVDYLNELFVPIFKESWPPLVLNEISRTLQAVARRTAEIPDAGDDKPLLFMEFLAEFSRDVDEL